MANANAKVKSGMKGSNGGRGRWTETEILKNDSKHARRELDKEAVKEAEDEIDCDVTDEWEIEVR